MKWKIIQSEIDEFVLLSDSLNIQKLKGKNAHDIVSVLLYLQGDTTSPNLLAEFPIEHFEIEYIDDIKEWLAFNNFLPSSSIVPIKMNVIGEFGDNFKLLNEFIKKLPEYYSINKVHNLSLTQKIENFDQSTFTLLIAPFYYNQNIINQIGEIQLNTKNDFLLIELFQNGIGIGPLMNLDRDTVCINCIEKRRIFNYNAPKVIFENILEKKVGSVNINNVLEIGNFNINCNFIYNELLKYSKKTSSHLYNKSVFIDFNRYENQSYEVLKVPHCEICNNTIIYNPL
jgi:bacteriocin biosynthesis cyclodehydratase domain-containing protein